MLVTASFLVRPILLPTLALLWLAGINSVRPPKRVVPGLISGLVLVGLSIAVMVRLEGGWAAFIEPFLTHADYHTARLHLNLSGVENLGLANGVGGPLVAAALLVAALVGIAVWWRRVGPRAAASWVIILGLTTAQLYALQNRSYARYAVGVQVASAPLLAGAAALVPAPAAAAGLLALTGVVTWRSLPLLEEQHRKRFGAWEATVEAANLAAERDWAVVVEPEVHVFSSYWWHLLEAEGRPAPPMVLSPRAPEPWLGVDRPWAVATVHPHLYFPSLTGQSTVFGQVSRALEPFTQNRFLSAEVIANPPLPVGQWWTREELPNGTPFMWAGPTAELWLPPVPKGTLIGLALRPSDGPAPLEVLIAPGGTRVELEGRAEISRLWTRLDTDSSSAPIIVKLTRSTGYPPGDGDDRPLAAQLLDVIVRPPGVPFGGPAASAEDRWRLRLEIDGSYEPEDFGALGRGTWLEPEAHLRLSLAEPGRLTILLAAPRPTPPRLRVTLPGRDVANPLEIGQASTPVTIDVAAAELEGGVVDIEVISDPFIPSESGTGDDSRRLGVVLLGLEFRARPSPALAGGQKR